MPTTVEFEFDQFEPVQLKHDPDKQKRVITAYCFRGTNKTYELSIGAYTSWHLGPEIEKWADPHNPKVGFNK